MSHDPKPEPKPAKIHAFTVTGDEKNAWVRAAKPARLTDWMRATLNRAAGHQPNPPPDET